MKILYLTNIPSPYRVDYFNELGKYCDLTVIFERVSSSERDNSWKNFHNQHFKAIFLKGINVSVDSSASFEVLSYINRKYDKIFITNFSSFTGILAILKLKIMNIPYYLESDGGFPGTGKGIKERLKYYVIKDAKKYYSTGKVHDQYYLKYGAKYDQLVRYPFSSVYKKDIIDLNKLDETHKRKYKKYLGIEESKVILMVGQFIHRKGIDLLLESAKKIQDDIGIYIIGGKPTPEYIEIIKKNNLDNIHFYDFQEKKRLSLYYMAADLFVFPTREDIWGLVINEALSHGLPVITTKKCLAGTELIKHGENGYIIDVNSAQDISKYVNLFFSKDTDRMAFIYNCLKIIDQYTIEKMVEKHLQDNDTLF